MKQRGISIVTAIFLMVVMAALGVAMMTFSTVQQITSAEDVQGARAYHGARTGIEWGVYKVLRESSCAASTALPALGGALAGFSVTVQCSASGPYPEAGGSLSVYLITSTATQGTAGTVSYVERQLQTTIAK